MTVLDPSNTEERFKRSKQYLYRTDNPTLDQYDIVSEDQEFIYCSIYPKANIITHQVSKQLLVHV